MEVPGESSRPTHHGHATNGWCVYVPVYSCMRAFVPIFVTVNLFLRFSLSFLSIYLSIYLSLSLSGGEGRENVNARSLLL